MADEAVLQIEFDRARLKSRKHKLSLWEGTSATMMWHIAREAASDVIENGGTLVVVADDKKVTIVQRPPGSDEF